MPGFGFTVGLVLLVVEGTQHGDLTRTRFAGEGEADGVDEAGLDIAGGHFFGKPFGKGAGGFDIDGVIQERQSL